MPMVGIGSSAVIRAATLGRDAFEDDGERPGLGHGVGVGEDLVGVALDLEAAEPADRLRGQADVAHDRDARRRPAPGSSRPSAGPPRA